MYSKLIEFKEILDISPEFFYESLINLPDYWGIKCLIRPVLDKDKNELRTLKRIYIFLQDELLATLMVSVINSDRIEVLMFRIKNEAIENNKSIRTVQLLANTICGLDPKHKKVKNYFKAFDYCITLTDDLMDVSSDEIRRIEPVVQPTTIQEIDKAIHRKNGKEGGRPRYEDYDAAYQKELETGDEITAYNWWKKEYPKKFNMFLDDKRARSAYRKALSSRRIKGEGRNP